jgi:hypothetical protein
VQSPVPEAAAYDSDDGRILVLGSSSGEAVLWSYLPVTGSWSAVDG